MIIFYIAGGCSPDPIGELFDSSSGPPYTEQIGPYLRITFNAGPDWYPCWSSRGTHIAYSAGGFERITQGQITVNVIPSAGGISTRVSPVWSRIDNNFFPCWIDGDNSFIYVAFRGMNFAPPLPPSILVVNSIDIQEFRENENMFSLSGPLDLVVSPDERAIAYSDSLPSVPINIDTIVVPRDINFLYRTTRSSPATAIWYAEFPLTGESRMVEGTEGATGLTWSPDSETIAFSRGGDIYTISHQGGVPVRFFEGESPAWSPDGSWIACSIDSNLYVYNLNDGERTQVTTEGGVDPAWSPDSEKLAFSWNRYGNFDIYIVALDDIIRNR
jgi:Tol biopolymer transport system component